MSPYLTMKINLPGCYLTLESIVVKSFYSAMQVGAKSPDRFLWKVKFSPKIKTFLWLFLKRIILTRDVLLHRGGRCEPTCLFCGHSESIDHLFFQCPLCRYIWNIAGCSLGTKCDFYDTDTCFNVWLKNLGSVKKKLFTVGVAAVIWSICKARNLACFQKKWPSEPSAVLFRVSFWPND